MLGRSVGAWGPKAEVGTPLSYDVIDRSVAPYIGVHYERYFGETKGIKVAKGKEGDSVWLITGLRLIF